MFVGVPQFGSINYWSLPEKKTWDLSIFFGHQHRGQKKTVFHGTLKPWVVQNQGRGSLWLHQRNIWTNGILSWSGFCMPFQSENPPRDRFTLMILGSSWSSCQLLVQWAYEITVIQDIKGHETATDLEIVGSMKTEGVHILKHEEGS